MAQTKAMTGNEVRALREGLDFTTVQFGKLLGLGPSAVTRWESKKSRAVHMDPFAAHVAEIIVSQSRRLGKGRFGEIVGRALEHEHDLFALWKILSLAFGETVKVAKKVTGGRNAGKAKRVAKKAARTAKRDLKTARRTTRKTVTTRRAKRVPRTKRATTSPSKAKRAPTARARTRKSAATSESKAAPSPDLVEGTNGIPQA